MEHLKLKSSILYALYFTSIFVVSFAIQFFLFPEMISWGITPRETKGLIGIVCAPLIHSSFSHFFSNIAPLFLLSFLIFYHFRAFIIPIIFSTWLLSGFLVWLSAREATHIGASGVVYGLAFYLITVGFLLKNRQSLAIALFVIFLYGGLVWGMFPSFTQFMPEKNISWESHLWGGIMGIISGFLFKPNVFYYETELDDSEQDDENPYWMNGKEENEENQ